MVARSALLMVLMTTALAAAGCFLNGSHYRDSRGSLIYVGEVYNEGAPVAEPLVYGTFYDANGDIIATALGVVCQPLPANGIAAFAVGLPPETPDPARVEWLLLGDRVNDAGLATGLSAEILETRVGPGGHTFVYGELTNNSSNSYLGGHVCAAWVDERGQVIRVAEQNAAGLRLDPGQSIPFQLIEQLPGEATGVNFYLDAGITAPGERVRIVDLPMSAFRSTSQETTSNTPLGMRTVRVGEVHNTRPNGLLSPEIFGIVPDDAGFPAVTRKGDDCSVPAAPGSFTYAAYDLITPYEPGLAAQLRIEARDLTDLGVRVIETKQVRLLDGGSVVREVTGVVTNTSSVPLSRIEVCAGAYDGSGLVRGIGAAPVEPSGLVLAPGASAPFLVRVATNGEVTSAKAVASGQP